MAECSGQLPVESIEKPGINCFDPHRVGVFQGVVGGGAFEVESN